MQSFGHGKCRSPACLPTLPQVLLAGSSAAGQLNCPCGAADARRLKAGQLAQLPMIAGQLPMLLSCPCILVVF